MGNKEDIGSLIRSYRMFRGMTQAQLAELVGVKPSTIAMYETGKREPDMDTLEALADVFNIKKRDLIPESESETAVISINNLQSRRIPLVGSAAAGEPIYDEEYDSYVNGPLKADCAIRVKGQSMEPTYIEGDILYIHSQPDIDYQGQVAVVICDNEACVKHVYKQQEGLLLISDNPRYNPIQKHFADYGDTLRVLGKVIGFTRLYE